MEIYTYTGRHPSTLLLRGEPLGEIQSEAFARRITALLNSAEGLLMDQIVTIIPAIRRDVTEQAEALVRCRALIDEAHDWKEAQQ